MARETPNLRVAGLMAVAGDLAVRLVELADLLDGPMRAEAVRLALRADRLADDLLGLSIGVDWQKKPNETIH